MHYTLLRLTADGVPLWEQHLRRLGLEASSAARDTLVAALRGAAPGIWAVTVDESGGVRIEPRPRTRLADGMPVRLHPSPVGALEGAIPKPMPPGPYASVRQDGVATLLTSPDGGELYEACSAAVLGWDGASIVFPPPDRPRVWSTAEAAIRAGMPVRDAVLPADSDALVLVNAVKGTCTLAGRSAGVPARVLRELDALLLGSTRWPEP